MADELKAAFDRISELETFIDRIKFGQEQSVSKSNTSASLSQQNLNLSKSTSNLRAFPDETRLNMSAYSLQNVSGDLNTTPPKHIANSHHRDLLDDLAEKALVIEKLEIEIGQLRTDLDTAKHSPRPNTPQKKSVHSLLEDLSERENQIFEKEEQIFKIQDELSTTKRENQNLKKEVHNLSRETRRSTSSINESGSNGQADIIELTQKCQMQQEIITKMTEQIQLLRSNEVCLL